MHKWPWTTRLWAHCLVRHVTLIGHSLISNWQPTVGHEDLLFSTAMQCDATDIWPALAGIAERSDTGRS